MTSSPLLPVPVLVATALMIGPTVAPQDDPCTDWRVAAEGEDLSVLLLDELIEHLPRIGNESWWEQETGTEVWSAAVLELDRRLLGGVQPSDEQWRRALANSGVLRVRERWPAERPFAFSLGIPAWLRDVEITARLVGASEEISVGGAPEFRLCSMDLGPSKVRSYVETASLTVGHRELVFEVAVTRSGTGGEPGRLLGGVRPSPYRYGVPAQVLWQGRFAFDVEVVPEASEVLRSDDSEDLTRAIRSALGIDVRSSFWGSESERRVHLSLEPDVAEFPRLCKAAVGLQFAVLRDGEVQDEGWLVWVREHQGIPADERLPWLSPEAAQLESFRIDELLDSAALTSCSVRVRGVPDHVLGLWGTDRWWNGEVEIPMTELLRNAERRVAGTRYARDLACPP